MAKKTKKAKVGNQKLAVGYVRVSTDDQKDGPEAQRQAILSYATREGIEVVSWHEDRGVSGASSIDERPGFLAALETIETHAAGLLLIAKRDRLARDIVVGATAERLVERIGAKVVTTDGTGNGDTPEAALMRGMVDLFAQYERHLIRARTRSALRSRRTRDLVAGNVPFGYRVSQDGAALSRQGRPTNLVRDEAAEQMLTRARELRSNGYSLRRVSDILASEGFKTRGGLPYGPSFLLKVLASPAQER